MAEEFKVGDVVHLRSGGPSMTVLKVYENGLIDCIWCHENKYCNETLSSSVLMKAY